MHKTVARVVIIFIVLFVSNNLTGNPALAFDGGGPTPTCGPTTCYPPLQK